jgi:hypothetical protein
MAIVCTTPARTRFRTAVRSLMRGERQDDGAREEHPLQPQFP